MIKAVFGDTSAFENPPVIHTPVAGEALWQPIETAPHRSVAEGAPPIDLWARGKRWADCFWLDATAVGMGKGWWKKIGDGGPTLVLRDDEPSHWMPLPGAPAQ